MFAPESAPHPTISTRSLVLILGSLAALGPLSIDMYLPAFPRIAEGLGTSLASVQTSLASYFLGLSIGQLLYGPASDRFGRKPPLYLGLVIYLAASIACALAPTVEFLIVARFFQALGGCAGMVITRAIIRDRFLPHESARIFSLLMLVMGAAPILAPFFGAQIATAFGWRWIFWVLVGSSALAFLSIARLLPESHRADPSRRISGVFPVYWQLLKDRNFMLHALAGGCGQAAMFTYITGSPFVLISIFGVPSENYGYIFGSNAFGLILAAQLNARLLQTRSIHRILDRTFPVLFLCATALLITSARGGGLIPTLVPLFIYIATLGLTFPNTTAGALAHERRNLGSASALLGTLQFALASVASSAVTRLHDGTAAPMALVMFAMSTIACVAYLLLRLRTPKVSAAPS